MNRNQERLQLLVHSRLLTVHGLRVGYVPDIIDIDGGDHDWFDSKSDEAKHPIIEIPSGTVNKHNSGTSPFCHGKIHYFYGHVQ